MNITEFPTLFQKQRDFFYTGKTLDKAFRIEQLKKFKALIQDNENAFYDALYQDLNKSQLEAYAAELSMIYKEIDFFIKRLGSLMRPKSIKTNLLNQPGKSKLVPHPYGQTCIISPWNYPVQLALLPLVDCIAAGNTAVVKPSEISPHCSALMTRLFNEAFDEEYLIFIEGDAQTTTDILKQPFDKICFTGSTHVGGIIAKSTAHYLPSLTLELGGKSPCIVTQSANIEDAARKIAWGKTLNSGQTCIAPDYLLVDNAIKDQFVTALKKEITQRYGEHTHKCDDLSKIISPRHYERLKAMIPEQVAFGGEYDDERCKIDVTLIDNATLDDPVMGEEIFGPLFPIMGFDCHQDVLNIVRQRRNPLALYLFTQNQKDIDIITGQLSFGGCTINDTMMHIANHHIPFGGVGGSGQGAYHGEHGFEDFSHYKPIMRKSSKSMFDLPLRYVPYTPKKFKTLKKLLKLI